MHVQHLVRLRNKHFFANSHFTVTKVVKTAAVWSGLGTNSTWLGLGKDNALSYINFTY